MTTLKQRIKDEMKAALLSGDRFVGDTLRNLGAAILDEEVKQGVRETGLDDAAVEQVIVREVKKRRDAAAIYRTNGRPELAGPGDWRCQGQGGQPSRRWGDCPAGAACPCPVVL